MTYYEERYRLSGRAVAGLIVSLILVAVCFLRNLPVIFIPIALALAVVTTQGAG